MQSPGIPNVHAALQTHFGFSEFKTGQEETLRACLEGRDCVVIMPTGSGKSLCYQLAAMVLEGVTLIISPLIALMKDQVDSLSARRLPATFLNSSLSWQEMESRLEGLSAGAFKLVYVAPERFRNRDFRERLRSLPVSLLAVDEAHCISQWGHDFRPDYLRLKSVLALLPKARIMALTATATPEVRADIVDQLGLGIAPRQPPLVAVHGFERPNLHLAVTRTPTHAAKLQRILEVVSRFPTGIVYGSTRKQVERVQGLLQGAGCPCELYHAGMTDTDRKTVQDRFMNGKAPLVAATNAFGMGVDRSDLRMVIHWDIPGSVEAYYQEIGRAGRDGRPAWCELLFNYADVRTQEFFLEGSNPTRAQVESVWRVVRETCASEPCQRTLPEWARLVVGVKNEMTVRTAMALLERAGLIERERDAGESYTTRLVPGADTSALSESFALLDLKRQRDRKKLDTMLRYVDTPGCRHAFVLSYFGEETVAPRCRACDRCVRSVSAGCRTPTEEEWVIVQKALSCVARMSGRFGLARVIQVLLGSQAQPVLDRQLDRLPTYGLLKTHGEPYLRALLEELIRDGCVAVVAGDYPVVELTPRGGDVMRRRAELELDWPEEASRKTARRERQAPLLPDPKAFDPALLFALKQWRMKLAQARSVPAYAILNDDTLKAIASQKPETLTDLESIKGIGPSKLAKFGKSVLDLVAEHRDD